MRSRDHENQVRWKPGKKGHYEVYFIKFNDPARGIGVWLRYTFLIPQEGEGKAEVWGFFVDSPFPKNRVAIKNSYPLSSLHFSPPAHPFCLQIQEHHLHSGGALGKVQTIDNSIHWNLTWEKEEESPIFYLFPYSWMYKASFPKTKVLCPHPALSISGILQVNGKEYEFKNLPGQQSHLWGREYARSWTWLQSSVFTEEKAIFEGLSARISLGKKISPPITVGLFQFRGRLYYLNSLPSMFQNKSTSETGRWEFWMEGPHLALQGEASASYEKMVGAEYTGPKGEKRWCHNSKIGTLLLSVYKRKKGKWKKESVLTSPEACAMEWVGTEKDPRLSFWA